MIHPRSTACALLLDIAAGCGSCAQSFSSTNGPTAAPQPPVVQDSERVLVPHVSWNCGMADGIPKPENGTLLLEAQIQLDNVYDVGKTPFGKRQVAVTQAGTMTGPTIQAAILPGGLDF